MGLLEGRKGLIFGIANDRSIACSIAACFQAEGAISAFPYLPGEKNDGRLIAGRADVISQGSLG